MKNSLRLTLVGLSLAMFAACLETPVAAQLRIRAPFVDIFSDSGEVHVRAPFVSVDTDRLGTRVWAPFTHVETARLPGGGTDVRVRVAPAWIEFDRSVPVQASPLIAPPVVDPGGPATAPPAVDPGDDARPEPAPSNPEPGPSTPPAPRNPGDEGSPADKAAAPPRGASYFVLPNRTPRKSFRLIYQRSTLAAKRPGNPKLDVATSSGPVRHPASAKGNRVLYELQPIRHYDFARGFRPSGGIHLIAFHHPFSGETVCVELDLPQGRPRIDIDKDEIELDYGRYEVKVKFRRDGRVTVKYDD